MAQQMAQQMLEAKMREMNIDDSDARFEAQPNDIINETSSMNDSSFIDTSNAFAAGENVDMDGGNTYRKQKRSRAAPKKFEQ